MFFTPHSVMCLHGDGVNNIFLQDNTEEDRDLINSFIHSYLIRNEFHSEEFFISSAVFCSEC